jgi:hypothetical protein
MPCLIRDCDIKIGRLSPCRVNVGIDALLDKGRGKEGSWEKEEALRAGFKRLRRERGKLRRYEARKMGKRRRFGSREYDH